MRKENVGCEWLVLKCGGVSKRVTINKVFSSPSTLSHCMYIIVVRCIKDTMDRREPGRRTGM